MVSKLVKMDSKGRISLAKFVSMEERESRQTYRVTPNDDGFSFLIEAVHVVTDQEIEAIKKAARDN